MQLTRHFEQCYVLVTTLYKNLLLLNIHVEECVYLLICVRLFTTFTGSAVNETVIPPSSTVIFHLCTKIANFGML